MPDVPYSANDIGPAVDRVPAYDRYPEWDGLSAMITEVTRLREELRRLQETMRER